MTSSGHFVVLIPFFSNSPKKTAYISRFSWRKRKVEISGRKVPERASEVKLESADFSVFELKLFGQVPNLVFKLI